MIQGVIFDMDGLMFDTERLWATFWVPELARYGLAAPAHLAEETCGITETMLLDVLHGYFGASFDAEQFVKDMRARAYEAFFASPVPKKEGLDALIAYLKAEGIPMSIASSSPEALVRNNLAQNNLLADFPICMTGDKIAVSKPAPDIFLAAAKAMGVSPAHCLVLEDSYNGVRAGAAGGFVTVMVPDLMPANDEMQGLCTAIYENLTQVKQALETNAF